jgi:hypothetical protein
MLLSTKTKGNVSKFDLKPEVPVQISVASMCVMVAC